MPSSVSNDDLGRTRSLAKRSRAAETLLWDIRRVIVRLARHGQLGKTLREIAEQLNEAGLKTNHGNRFDAQKVQRTLELMGVDRPAIRRWQRLARERAAEWRVPVKPLIHQLWIEWLHHESTGWIMEGASLMNRAERAFRPTLVHPDEWEPPWVRDPECPTRYVQATPPAARVVYALLGAFELQRT